MAGVLSTNPSINQNLNIADLSEFSDQPAKGKGGRVCAWAWAGALEVSNRSYLSGATSMTPPLRDFG
jgi:hypothetical protein